MNPKYIVLYTMEAKDLAYIITHYINSKGDTVSPKKLQKLAYYVEAWHLVYFDNRLINEDFEAWVHGPVVPSLYHELKKFGYNNLDIVKDEQDTVDGRIDEIIKRNKLTDDQMELIYSVLNKYGVLSSFELEMLAHSEKPWIEARDNFPPNERCQNVISRSTIKSFYKSQLLRNVEAKEA